MTHRVFSQVRTYMITYYFIIIQTKYIHKYVFINPKYVIYYYDLFIKCMVSYAFTPTNSTQNNLYITVSEKLKNLIVC